MKPICLLASLLSLPFFLTAQQAGSPDNTFGTNGFTNYGIHSSTDIAWDLALQPDGKIIQVGQTYNFISTEYGVARLLANGAPDPTFGTNGRVSLPVEGTSNDYCRAVALLPDGKILIGGQYNLNADDDWALMRLTPAGALDNSFGTGGVQKIRVSDKNDDLLDLLVQPDGKILCAGLSDNTAIIMRLNANGTPDNSFGSSGKVTLTASSSIAAYALILLNDGTILVGGERDNQMFAVRLSASGVLDNSFGTGGFGGADIVGGIERGRAMSLLADGKILLGGSRRLSSATGFDFAVMRLNANGALDNSFGQQGLATVDFNNNNDEGFGMAVQPDGKILLGGSSQAANSDWALGRLNADGSLDDSFGTNGRVVKDFGSNEDIIYKLLLQPDLRLLASGYVQTPGYDFALARYQTGLTVGVFSLEPLPLTLYPNPAKSYIVLEGSGLNSGRYQCRIIDAFGRLMLNQVIDYQPGGVRLQLPLSLTAGVYSIQVQNNEATALARLLVR